MSTDFVNRHAISDSSLISVMFALISNTGKRISYTCREMKA